MKRNIFRLLLVIYLIISTMPPEVSQSISASQEEKEINDFASRMQALYDFIETHAPFVHDMSRDARQQVIEHQEQSSQGK